MSWEKRVALDSIEYGSTGTIFVKLTKGIWDTEAEKWVDWAPESPITHPHRFPVEPTAMPEEQMAAVKTHLESWGYVVPNEVVDRVNKRVHAMRD